MDRELLIKNYLILREKGFGCNVIAKELGITKSLSKRLRIETKCKIADRYLYKKLTNTDIKNIIACIFGDGCLFKPKNKNSNIYGKISCIDDNRDYLLLKQKTIRDFVYEIHTGREAQLRFVNNKIINCKKHIVLNLKASPHLYKIYQMMYVNGKKAITHSLLKYFDEKCLAFLYFDDGSYCKNNKTYKISLGNMDIEYIQLFSNYLKNHFKIDNNINFNSKSRLYYDIYICRNSHDTFENLIIPYLVDSMKYKIRDEVKSDKLLENPEKDNQQPS